MLRGHCLTAANIGADFGSSSPVIFFLSQSHGQLGSKSQPRWSEGMLLESRTLQASSIASGLVILSFLSYQVREVGQVGQGQLPPQDSGDSHQMVTVETTHSVAESIKRNQQDEVSISVLPGSVKTEWLHVLHVAPGI